jgi:hypothetical protein
VDEPAWLRMGMASYGCVFSGLVLLDQNKNQHMNDPQGFKS